MDIEEREAIVVKASCSLSLVSKLILPGPGANALLASTVACTTTILRKNCYSSPDTT